jgi:hypothetical protein
MPRLVYSLRFETERKPGGPITEFIVPLDPQGNSRNFRPAGKPRVVDLRPGDHFLHEPTKQDYRLTAMSAYRQHDISEEKLASGWKPSEGFLVPR